MITLEDDGLEVRFPDLHPSARLTIAFQRTLRIPEDGKEWPLPPGLGRFPLRHVEDYAAGLPEVTVRRGGVLLPMYQSEALWISFGARLGGAYPFAVKVAAGKINAVTGEAPPMTARSNGGSGAAASRLMPAPPAGAGRARRSRALKARPLPSAGRRSAFP